MSGALGDDLVVTAESEDDLGLGKGLVELVVVPDLFHEGEERDVEHGGDLRWFSDF